MQKPRSKYLVTVFLFKTDKRGHVRVSRTMLKKKLGDTKKEEREFETKQKKKNRARTHALLSAGVQAALAGHGNGNGRGPAAVSGGRLARRVEWLAVLRLALGQEHVDGQRRRVLRRRALRR